MKYVRNIAWVLMALGGFIKSPEMVYIALAALLVYYAYGMISFFSQESVQEREKDLDEKKRAQEAALRLQNECIAESLANLRPLSNREHKKLLWEEKQRERAIERRNEERRRFITIYN